MLCRSKGIWDACSIASLQDNRTSDSSISKKSSQVACLPIIIELIRWTISSIIQIKEGTLGDPHFFNSKGVSHVRRSMALDDAVSNFNP